MKAFYWLGMVAMLAACSSEPTVKNAASPEASSNSTSDNDVASEQTEPSETGAQATDSSLWSVSTSTDPMNDAEIVKAVADIPGTSVDLQIEVVCKDKKSLSYKISSFGKDGKGVEMRDVLHRPLGHAFMYRVDKAPERMEPWDNPQYTNQAGIITHSEDAALARTLLLRLQFSSSSETYSVNQSSPEFRNAVAGCLSSVGAANASEDAGGVTTDSQEGNEGSADTSSEPLVQ